MSFIKLLQIEKLEREKLIRDLEAEVALQAARAETTAATLRVLEDQRSAEMSALAEQHKEELVAAQSKYTPFIIFFDVMSIYLLSKIMF